MTHRRMPATALRTACLMPALLATLAAGCDTEGARDDAGLLDDATADDHADAGKADDNGSGSAFDRNRLLSDAAVLDADAFTAAEIDAFLADPYDDGMPSCLAKERFGGRTAGSLIQETATKHGLNPLFLLTHLQKESSLVGTLGTCSRVAMDEAFGCGCPDGGGCAPEFRGFGKQLECAGNLTRSYFNDLDAGKATVSGWKVGQGKSTLDPYTVTPQTKATAVLYTYTPWVGDKNAGGNAAPFGNYLFWQVWRQYASTLGYTVDAGGPQPGGGGGDVPDGATEPLASWSYILDTDYGLRKDGLGEGYFQAPRSGGRLHNGLDLLGSRGEPLYAPCAGEALSGSDGAFGNWVQVVCPVQLGGKALYASMLYAHLDRRDVGKTGWQNIAKDTRVGTLGSTGNASGSNPHVHFEIIFHSSRTAAINELHSGNDTSSNATSDQVLAILQDECLEPNGFDSKNPAGIIRYGRRFDPYLAMICLGANKAAIKTPSASLQSTWVKWSQWYQAATFDVDTWHL